jgi:hypothetical protein
VTVSRRTQGSAPIAVPGLQIMRSCSPAAPSPIRRTPASPGLFTGPGLHAAARERVKEEMLVSEADSPPQTLWVPEASSTSRDQAIFVDRATNASLSSYAVLVEIDRLR